MTNKQPTPSSILAFKEAINGGKGNLDAWLEVNDEDEVRNHINALIESASTFKKMTNEQRQKVFYFAEQRTLAFENISWRDAIVDEVEDYYICNN